MGAAWQNAVIQEQSLESYTEQNRRTGQNLTDAEPLMEAVNTPNIDTPSMGSLL